MRESNTRLIIDKLLRESEWVLYGDEGKVNVDTETPNKSGRSDYLLLSKLGFPICVLEAKRKDLSPLVGKEKSREYAKSLRCRFVILSNGFTHYFWDIEQGNPSNISIFPTQNQLEIRKEKFNPPRDTEEVIESDYIAKSQYPEFEKSQDFINQSTRADFIKENKIRLLRNYQIDAVKEIQNAVIRGNERFLLEMATGTGKTLTSAAIIKMFLRLYKVKRILFLVDRIELENQAKKEFDECLANDYSTSIWKENKSDWIKSEIVISTIQSFTRNNKYKNIFEPDTFDLVISDEAHRSLGASSRKVFEYFIGFKLGLTATPKDYLKSIDLEQLSIYDPAKMDRRLLLDTYNTFGCESGIPTFRYSLKDGIKDGYLVNPKVIDARTEITTELLSEEGYVVELINNDGEDEAILFKKDFEKKFFSENTNFIFCETFLNNALRDPFTGLIGKTLVFCVSQKHATKITQILNILADQVFPNTYNSDFAIQVTSDIDADSQQMTIDFRNNALSGKSNKNPYYLTSKTRVCVTVGMMTTGYDCSDILNICLMRPVFSPSDFIQMKGRGTRRFNFEDCWIKGFDFPKINKEESNKNEYFLFDFFGNYEYFEKDFNYDEKLILPSLSTNTGDPIPRPVIDTFVSEIPDPLKELKETIINESCMRIDRDIYPSFKKKLMESKELREFLLNDQLDLAENHVEKNIMDQSGKSFTLEKISKSLGLDRIPSLQELIFYSLDYINYLPSHRECLEEEFEKLIKTFQIDEEFQNYAKEVFEAFTTDKDFREIILNKKYSELSIHPSGEAFKRLPNKFKDEIPLFISANVDIDKFKRC